MPLHYKGVSRFIGRFPLMAFRQVQLDSAVLRVTISPSPGSGGCAARKAEKARAYYHQVLEACAKIGFRPAIALTRLQLAELLLDEANVGAIHESPLRKEVMEHLDFAIGEFRDMKMQTCLERAPGTGRY